MQLLQQTIVLRLNKVWQAIGKSTVQDALVAMNSGDDFLKAAIGIDVQYSKLADGSWDLDNYENLVPTKWDDWINLPIRDFDYVVHTTKRTIRVPTVIIAQNFSKMPIYDRHPTKTAIRERDESRCQVSGKLLTKNEGNVDHLIAESRGGANTWENLVWMDKELNSKKGVKTLEEMGWKLIRKPFAPKGVPASAMIGNLLHRDWKLFLHDYK